MCVRGATGLLGETLTRALAERDLPVSELLPLARNRSVGKRVEFRGRHLPVIDVQGRCDVTLSFGCEPGCIISVLPLALSTVLESEAGLFDS